ncbi:hypothetical protein [Janthinobacterium violaceinigrum]|uniref:Uncharacterized protein n=1 Tax=Janthinobacterium violaceinigrum TaxID=2654252 RepID=A0A6I1I9F4_9BURK|nr:hypothetical protein [Janthinobacterium violaceinigrum]KAB8066369.1 hypothetical protein GCN75_04070 [Janthinobacterium violaceinigrum]
MKPGYAAVLMVMLACPAQSRAQDATCDADDRAAVTTLDALPAQVQYLLGRARPGIAGIADIGGKFNPSDVILDDTVPMRRLVGGVAGHRCIWLTVEYGGVGHYQKKLEYRLIADIWMQRKGADVERAPAVLPPAMR